jgi:tetrahydromethanopterin S-methyltransferase subunit F
MDRDAGCANPDEAIEIRRQNRLTIGLVAAVFFGIAAVLGIVLSLFLMFASLPKW